MFPRYLISPDYSKLEHIETDYLIIGTGIAGLYTALKSRDFGRVILLTKQQVKDSNTEFAQGGIAAAIGPSDSPHLHFMDTLAAGDGLCDPEAVKVLVNEGPDCVLELAALGAEFDREEDGFALTREGAHSQRRILHARGDATGEEVRRALHRRVENDPRITLLEDHFTIDILTDGDGRAFGCLVQGSDGRLKVFLAPIIALATGGVGQLYRNSTNPEVATGDGIAMAFRAGAEVQDLEFIQFHPTALYHEGSQQQGSPRFLISEAVRGEGALLINSRGERFMPRYHERAELAPRDVVARANDSEMRRTGHPCVYLDATHFGPGVFAARFPTIYRNCLERGIDPEKEPIPVAPAAHYSMGGIRTGVDGRTSIPGLFACGEAACTGLHGANRLASNSLVEGLVFGRRIALSGRDILACRPGTGSSEAAAVQVAVAAMPAESSDPAERLDVAVAWHRVQDLMWDGVGINREAEGLTRAMAELGDLSGHLPSRAPDRSEMELSNLATVGWLVAWAALARRESRGGHYRTDFPEHRDAEWTRHLVLSRRLLDNQEAMA